MNGVSASSLSSQPAFGGWSASVPAAPVQAPAGPGADPDKSSGFDVKSRRLARPDPADQLSDEEQARMDALKARDQEVRAHERAHQMVGGQYAGAASYTFEQGPDGRSYAVGGEVPIDASEIKGDPEATIEKMEQVKAAALAPVEPSGQDRKVAAMADAKAAQARAELNRAEDEGGEGERGTTGEKLQPSLSQQIAEMRDTETPAGPSSASTGPADLTAYAAQAYRHPALAGIVSHGGF